MLLVSRRFQGPLRRYIMHPRLSLLFVALFTLPSLAAPPTVVKATPDNGDQNVDPATKEIRITFDQPMSRGGHSIVGGGPTFPKIGRPRWSDDRTMVIPVTLQPDHDYWFSINSSTFTNFRSRSGESATPYPIAFRTGKTGGAPGPAAPAITLQQNKESVAELKRAIDLDYSYRDLRKVDWDKEFAAATPRLQAAKTPRDFAIEAAKMLAKAGDIHVWLQVGSATIPTHRRSYAANFNRITLANAVPGWKKHNDVVATGLFDDGTRYLFIASWPGGESADALEPAYELLADAAAAKKPLIIDVRANNGGDETAARKFAGCFIDEPKVYGKNTIRQDGRFSNPLDRTVQPNKARPQYRGKIAVLTGPGAISSCESFLLMMKQVPGCKVIGLPSAGASGNPHPVELANGVTVYLSRWQDMRPDGTCFEGEGIAPDITVKTETRDFLTSDPVLAAAREYLLAQQR